MFIVTVLSLLALLALVFSLAKENCIDWKKFLSSSKIPLKTDESKEDEGSSYLSTAREKHESSFSIHRVQKINHVLAIFNLCNQMCEKFPELFTIKKLVYSKASGVDVKFCEMYNLDFEYESHYGDHLALSYNEEDGKWTLSIMKFEDSKPDSKNQISKS